MRIRVQKFGGTSLRTAERRARAVEWVERACREGWRPVVVVSAMGRRGDPYATDTLLDLVADRGGSPRERDLLASCGEIIAAVVLSALLQAHQLNAEAVTGAEAGIVTDDEHGRARVLRVDATRLATLLERGIIPVVAGFQGQSETGCVTTLGRGASDTTAAILGAALGAEVVEIFTDVDGIKTADPALVPDARTLSALDYDEVFQMAATGARVVHPRAVEIARRFKVPLRIRDTLSLSPGTLVAAPAPCIDPWARRAPETAVSGITHWDDVVQVECRAPDPSAGPWPVRLFAGLADRGVSVDLINVFPDRVFFTIEASQRDRTREVLQTLAVDASLWDDRATVSIVGSAIQGLPGVMARVMAALDAAGVPVLQTSDSHSTISCLVARHQVEVAVRALHAEFRLADATAPSPAASEGEPAAASPGLPLVVLEGGPHRD
jgi:aspartate kinase